MSRFLWFTVSNQECTAHCHSTELKGENLKQVLCYSRLLSDYCYDCYCCL